MSISCGISEAIQKFLLPSKVELWPTDHPAKETTEVGIIKTSPSGHSLALLICIVSPVRRKL